MGTGATAVVGGTVTSLALSRCRRSLVTIQEGFASLGNIGVERSPGFFAALINVRRPQLAQVSPTGGHGIGAGCVRPRLGVRISEEIRSTSDGHQVVVWPPADLGRAGGDHPALAIMSFLSPQITTTALRTISRHPREHYSSRSCVPTMSWSLEALIITAIVMVSHCYGYAAGGGRRSAGRRPIDAFLVGLGASRCPVCSVGALR